jgi:hypothetical protein
MIKNTQQRNKFKTVEEILEGSFFFKKLIYNN